MAAQWGCCDVGDNPVVCAGNSVLVPADLCLFPLWRRRRCLSSLLGDGKGVLVGRGVGVWSLLAVTSFEVVAFLPGHDEVAMASLVARGHDEAVEHIFGPKRQ